VSNDVGRFVVRQSINSESCDNVFTLLFLFGDGKVRLYWSSRATVPSPSCDWLVATAAQVRL